MTKLDRINLIILLFFTSAVISAQNGVNSPYSRYGFGLLSDRSMGFNKGMGGVAQGFRDGQSINVQNAASYSEVDSLTALFDFGLTLQNGNYKMSNVQKNIRNTSIDYFAIHFRVANQLGVAAGIVPVANIKYSFSSSAETLDGTENVTSSYNFIGDGGLREVFLGAGWRPFKPVSIGFNASYLYGDYSHTMSMTFNESSVYSLARVYSAEINTYNVNFGIQYIQPLGKKNKFVLGASYGLGHDVKNSAFRATETINSSVVETVTTDTIRNAFQLPSSYAVGLTYYHSNNFRVGIDAELQKWGDVKFPNQQTGISSSELVSDATSQEYTSTKGQLYDRKKLAVGMDWIPNMYGKSYFSRMRYKVGAYYSQSYAKADITNTVSDKPNEFGISAGVTLPIVNRNLWHNSPKINISVMWVHSNIPYLNSATMRQSTLSENYLKLCVGLTFSERWFYKLKVQ